MTQPALSWRRLSGWGRFPLADCLTLEPDTTEAAAGATGSTATIARGNGRSYGDSSLAPARTLVTLRLDRMLAFDAETGVLTCEAGVLLADVVAVFVPRGWFVPVSPGTKFVTLGGMIAADVHGKNHHGSGSFCDHVLWLDLAPGDGTVLRCSRDDHPALFAATCGGMGLTGVILRAAFRMIPIRSAWIDQTVQRAPDLRSAMAVLEQAQACTYSVAWIDCVATGASLGRSVVFLGEHAEAGPEGAPPLRLAPRPARRVPLDLPRLALNPLSVKAFNALYYRRNAPGRSLIDLDRYFYPLDALLEWNRIYGAGGFVQYQCVIPRPASASALTELIGLAAQAGTASFLAVLKLMGRASFGLLSFPMEGFTLALDFPATAATLRLLDRFDAIVAAHGGRVYLAKDARTSPAMVTRGYPGLAEFRQTRARYGLDRRFASAQSARLGI